MRRILTLGIVLLCAACASTPEEVKPERISPHTYRDLTCRELVAEVAAGRREEAKLVARMNAWPTAGGGELVRRVDLGRKLANVRGKLKAAQDLSTRYGCEERLRYVGP
jgi:hypothetical protein